MPAISPLRDGEYVRDMVRTNGIESFWTLLKRGYHGIYHKMSAKHLPRYANEFAGRHNIREQDTAVQLAVIAKGFIGKRLRYWVRASDKSPIMRIDCSATCNLSL